MMSEKTSPRRLRLISAGVLAATFGLGVVTGGGIGSWIAAERREAAHDDLPRGPWPLRELDLSEEQRTRIHEVFERHRPKLDAVLRESFPLVRPIHEAIDSEIREVLTPEQRVRFDELKARRPFPPPGLSPPPGRDAPGPGAPPLPPPDRR
jgi:Spy/CpxP family protein refolding chaperone